MFAIETQAMGTFLPSPEDLGLQCLLQAKILVHYFPCLGTEILQQKDAIFSFFHFVSKESYFSILSCVSNAMKQEY